MSNKLAEYANELTDIFRIQILEGDFFVKVLSKNDDSGRHGVLIPTETYEFFPHLDILNAKENLTLKFLAKDAISKKDVTLAYKYYERYPERRVTRLNGCINSNELRLIVFLKIKDSTGHIHFITDAATKNDAYKFSRLSNLFFGDLTELSQGIFCKIGLDAPSSFHIDEPLQELLELFDGIKNLGWIDSLRETDNGVGFTFETLIGLKENNSKQADYKGIEIKCKQRKESGVSSTKTNLFQQGPTWLYGNDAKERIALLGYKKDDGLLACHSQVTVQANNLGLKLTAKNQDSMILLNKQTTEVAFWPYKLLQDRLIEKHSRAAFIKADVKKIKDKSQFNYKDLIYCERPSIERFMDLVCDKKIVFEFIMSEKPNGSIRNHGYPWRLVSDGLLDRLFSAQIQLR